MEEKFDVLTETGEYANRIESREDCHKYGFWHKAVAMFMINSKGQVLLQKRSANKKLWPNLWDITAGGHVLAGEFGFEAIIREIANKNLSYLINNRIFILNSDEIENKDILNFKANLVIDTHLGSLENIILELEEEYLREHEVVKESKVFEEELEFEKYNTKDLDLKYENASIELYSFANN